MSTFKILKTTILSLTKATPVSAQFNRGIEPPSDSPYLDIVGAGGDVEPLPAFVLFLSNLIGIITLVGGLFFIVYFFMGAFNWVTGGEDSGKVEKARQKMMHGVLGLVVLVMSYSLIGIVGTIVGIDLINLEETIMRVVPQ
ncbi:MAG: hypothetical protein GX660_14455 [Clostridiaceae bacterium]|nr:hypothetical protein [Clostridiaceae bacterium]